MNMIMRELKAARKSLIIWSIGAIFMVASGMSKYAAMDGTGATMNELMADMPKSLQAIMGTDGFDLSTAIGYYGLLFLYLAVMGTIHSVMLGANIIAKEERDKTAEFLLAKPVSRKAVLTSKLIAALVNVAVFNLVTFASSVGVMQKYAEGENVSGDIAILMAGLFMLQLLFLAIGACIAAAGKRPKRAGAIATAVLLLTFILSVVINLKNSLEPLKFVTPFKYFDAKQILADGRLDTGFTLLAAALTAALVAVTYTAYGKKDLNI